MTLDPQKRLYRQELIHLSLLSTLCIKAYNISQLRAIES